MRSSNETRTTARHIAAAFTLLFALAPLSAAAQYLTSDVVVHVSRGTFGFPGPIVSSIRIHSAAGIPKQTITTPGVKIYDVTYHDGTLFGYVFGPDAIGVSRINPVGDLTYVGMAGSFVFDARGNVYTGRGQLLEKFDSTGNLLGTWSLPNSVGEIDLSGDQCTVYYTSNVGGSSGIAGILRYNTCISQALVPLITGFSHSAAIGNLRVLPGGEVLIGTTVGVLRIAPNGQVTRTYPGTLQIALDPDGRSFWATDGLDSVSKVDMETGATVVRTPVFGDFPVDSLTVVGEPRAGLSVDASIPTLSQWTLLALLATLAVTGMVRLRA